METIGSTIVKMKEDYRCGNYLGHGSGNCRWVGAQIWQLLSAGAGHGCSIYLRALSHTRGTEVEINGAWM